MKATVVFVFTSSRVFHRIALEAQSKLYSQVKRRQEYKQISLRPCFPLFQHELISVLDKM